MYVLGFSNDDVGAGHRALQHSGYLPTTTNAIFSLRTDGISFVFAFNGDNAGGFSTYIDPGTPTQRRVPAGGWIAGDVLWPLHNIFNTMTLPNQDLWDQFGFEKAPVPGVDCSAAPLWKLWEFYTAGARVQVEGKLYQCKAFPANGWCGVTGYKPGIDSAWQDAWELVDVCNAGIVPGSLPSNDCSVLQEWTSGTYVGGDVVKHGGTVYKCKGWPQSGWCGQTGYEPGVTLYWADAWDSLGACV
jgi:hypothetical protein